MIRSILVANRGEIARRVMRTCRDLGIATVAVHSDADARAPHVAEADAAVRLPGNSPAETYLRGDLLIEAAPRAGADAVHPGYGFLSENAAFARRRRRRRPDVDRSATGGDRGDGLEDRGQAADGGRRRPGARRADASRRCGADDLPVLIKASAGGGGRGMRIVASLAVLDREVAAAQAEAASAFGDADGVLRAVPDARAPRRGADRRRRARHGVGARRAGVLDPAPPPEGDRGSAVAARRARRRDARRAVRRRRRRGAGDRLHRRRHRRVPRRRRRHVLLPRDEHAAAGRASRHRVHDRRRPRRPADRRRRRRRLDPCATAVVGSRDRGPPLRRGSRRRLAAAQRDAARRSTCRASSTEFANSGRPGIRLDSGVVVRHRRRHPLRPTARQGDQLRADPRRGRPGARRGARRGRASTASSPTATCSSACSRHPAFLAGDTDTSFFDRHGLATLAAPLADNRRRPLRRCWPPPSPTPRRNRADAAVLGAVPSGWRSVPSAPATQGVRRSAPASWTSTTDSPATGSSPTATTTSG